MAMYGGYLFVNVVGYLQLHVYFGIFWTNEFHGNVDDDPLIRWSLSFDEVPIYI